MKDERAKKMHLFSSLVPRPSSFVFRRAIFFCALSAVFFQLASAFAEAQWKEERGDHFIVYYMNDAAKPKDILWKAEGYYNRIADDLGYPRYSNFWQWNNRAKIYVHPNKEAFQKSTGQPAWSHGMASYLNKSIHTIEGTPNFLDAVLPHEITHLIFRDFVGLEGQIPLWLDEGVAQWEEDAKRQMALQNMPMLVGQAKIFTLQKLNATDIRRETDQDKVAVFYLEAISIVDYLIHQYGSSRFTQFCRNLRDGKKFEESLRDAFGASVGSIDNLETLWIKYVMAKNTGDLS